MARIKCNKFDLIGDLKKFIDERANLIIGKEYNNIYLLQNVNVLIKVFYEDMPNLYWTRSGCEVEDYQWTGGQSAYSDHDSVRILGALITHNTKDGLKKK